jgi:Icc-related predicted phosphoesterase
MNAVAICGDWHGDFGFASRVCKELKSIGVTEILHCGDFGYGWNSDYVPLVSEMLNRRGITLRWVPGNHENYDLIDQLMEHNAQWMGDYENIYVLDRGERFTIANTTFVGIGGGHSIDKAQRHAHISWWPQELITYSQVHRILQSEKCDVVIAHDAPLTADLELRNGYKDDPHTQGNRRMLGIAVDHLDPKYVFHGHYHQRHTTKDHHDRVVVGLADNREFFKDNYVLFNPYTKELI